MFLIKDKYIPKNISEYIINRNIIDKYKNFFNDDFMNLLIHGPPGSGKYVLALNILQNIFGDKIYNRKLNTIKYSSNSSNKEIQIVSSIYHHELYLNNYILNNKTAFIEILKELCATKNVTTNMYKIILIRNGDNISKENYFFFKHISEQYYETAKFIITFNSVSKITHDMRSVFTYLRVPYEHPNIIKTYLKDIAFKENVNIQDDQIDLLIKYSKRNLTKLLVYFELYFLSSNEYLDNDCGTSKKIDCKSFIELELDAIINLINKKKVDGMIDIRKKLYDIMTKNVMKINLYHYILNYYVKNNKFSLEIKKEITEKCAYYQHLSVNGYRDIIHLEAWIISIMDIISN